MNDYTAHLRRHRRLSILRMLSTAPECRANESLITDVLNQFAIISTRDQVRTELGWLQEQGFVAIEIMGDLMVAEITEGGLEVAGGRRTHPDVQKPGPRKR